MCFLFFRGLRRRMMSACVLQGVYLECMHVVYLRVCYNYDPLHLVSNQGLLRVELAGDLTLPRAVRYCYSRKCLVCFYVIGLCASPEFRVVCTRGISVCFPRLREEKGALVVRLFGFREY